jgi:hypothetical protein
MEKLAIDTLIATIDALKVLTYTDKTNTYLEANDPKALEQANKAIDKAEAALAKIRLTVAHDFEKTQKRVIKSMRIVDYYLPHQIGQLQTKCKDAGFLKAADYIASIRAAQKTGSTQKVSLDRVESLILTKEIPYQ